MKPPSSLIALLCVVAVGTACTAGGEDATSDTTPEEEQSQPCPYISEGEVVELTGLDLSEDRDSTSDILCSFVSADGPANLSVQLLSVPSPAEFAALRPTTLEPTLVEVMGADESLVWSQSDQTQDGVVRSGGSAARVTLVAERPLEGFESMESILELVAGNLPETEFEDVAAPGEAICAIVPIEAMREELGLPELQQAPAGNSRTCAYADAGSGVNLLVELPEGEAGQEQLDMDGRESTVEGTTVEWAVEPVDGLGDGALWTEDPVSERSGELLALFGTQLVRVTSSANEPGDALRDRAVLAARVASGQSSD